MLLDATGSPWCTGSAECYLDWDLPGSTDSFCVGVACVLGSALTQTMAVLDTAAEYSIMDSRSFLGAAGGSVTREALARSRGARWWSTTRRGG